MIEQASIQRVVDISDVLTKVLVLIKKINSGLSAKIVTRSNDIEFLKAGFLVMIIVDRKDVCVGLFVWSNNLQKLYGPFTKKPEEVHEQLSLISEDLNSESKNKTAEFLSIDGYLKVDDYFFTKNPKEEIPELQINFVGKGNNLINYCVSGLDDDPEKVSFEEDHG